MIYGYHKGSGSTRPEVKSAVSQLGPGSTRPESTRPGVFSALSYVYGIWFALYTYNLK